MVGELHGGHQSRLYRARRTGGDYVAKLTERRFVDDAYFARLDLAGRLAAIDSRVVGPLPIEGSLATAMGEWFVVAYPFVQGRSADPTDRGDVTAMAATLAELHDSMRTLDVAGLPRVAALRDVTDGLGSGRPEQLLHGDYGASNIVVNDAGVRIIDFDDAGWGPVEFEIGNTLYMAMFDATVRHDLDEYRRFREWFVDGYGVTAASAPELDVVDAAITLRKRALANWLDDLPNAPIGVRSASPEWRRLLRRFVNTP